MSSEIAGKFSALGRPLNFSYKTNLIIALITGVSIIGAFLFFLIYESVPFFEAALNAFYFGISIFLSWAICREIDPDNNLSAFLSVIITFIFLMFYSGQELLILFWLLLTLRLINQVVGKEATIFDLIILLGFAAFFSFDGYPVLVLLASFAFFADVFLESKNRKSLIFGILAAALFVYTLFNYKFVVVPENYIFIIVLVLLFIPFNAYSKNIQSKTDFFDRRLNPLRIRAAQFFILVFIISIDFSKINLTQVIPAISSAAATPIYFYFRKLQDR